MIPRVSSGTLVVILSGAKRSRRIPDVSFQAAQRDPSTSLGMTGAHLKSDRLLAVVVAAFDVQLGERFLQRRLNGCHLFGGLIFFHRRLGALDCCLGRGNVDLLGFKGHVS